MHAGGSHERITLLPISSDNAADEEAGGGEGLKEAEEDGAALDAIWTKFADFDVEQAKCTKEEERQHLLAVIEAAFGDLAVFNSLVRHMFTTEFLERHDKQVFSAIDENHDGIITRSELGAYVRASKRASTSSSMMSVAPAARVMAHEP